jgi:hypothetical protein
VRVSWQGGLLKIETANGPCMPAERRCLPPFPSPGVVIDEEVYVPGWVADLESFHRWAESEECPERVRLSFLGGALWIDRTMEQAYSHNGVKTEVAYVLYGLVRETGVGRYFGDGMALSHAPAHLSTTPDGMFISTDAFLSGRVRRVPGRETGVIRFAGSPEMVLEVVSASSEGKDFDALPGAYHRAGVSEFWRIDARGAEPVFEILRWEAAGYVLARLPDGWCASAVFGRAFRLTARPDPLGDPLFILEMRP